MEWLSKKSGKSYRLPKEDEWKYACDGGQEHQYCGGEDLGSLGWYDGNSGGKTHPVGQKRANGYGLYDMSGNAWERMQECWGGLLGACPAWWLLAQPFGERPCGQPRLERHV